VSAEAPEFRYPSGAGLVGDDAGDQKQRGLEARVVQDVERARLRAVGVGEAEPGDDEAEVRGRRVREQFLDVGRAHREHRGDGHRHESEHREHERPLAEDGGVLGEKERPEPADQVDAGLDHGRGVEERRHRRRRLHRVREPDVKRDLRGLGGRADPDEQERGREETGPAKPLADRPGVLDEDGNAVGLGREHLPGDPDEKQEADEHEQAAGDGDEHRLPGGVLGGRLVGVVADEDERREARQLPEDEQRHEVGRERHAEHRAHEREQRGVVLRLSRLPVHVSTRVRQDEDADTAGEKRDQERQPVDVERQGDAERRDPLERRRTVGSLQEQTRHQRERRGGDERRVVGRLLADHPVDEWGECGTEKREEDDGENDLWCHDP